MSHVFGDEVLKGMCISCTLFKSVQCRWRVICPKEEKRKDKKTTNSLIILNVKGNTLHNITQLLFILIVISVIGDTPQPVGQG